jgi:hypothetical protein
MGSLVSLDNNGSLDDLQAQVHRFVEAGQLHLIFGIGSTGLITTNQFSMLYCASTHYKLFEKLDAIALRSSSQGVDAFTTWTRAML